MLQHFLQDIGLNSDEAKVYLTALELGNKPASIIARKAEFKRVHTYLILGRLIKMGLASKQEKAGIIHFQMIEPEMLDRFLAKKESKLQDYRQRLKTLLPQFQSHKNPSVEMPKVSFYEGVEGLKTMYEDTLVGTESSVIYGFSDYPSVFSGMEGYVDDYPARRVGQQTKNWIITTETEMARDYQKRNRKDMRDLRFIPKKYGRFATEVNVYQDKVSIMAFGAEKNGVIIENKAIADTMRVLWKVLWDGLKG